MNWNWWAAHRRRDASYRLPPLQCGCRDPWTCRCFDPQLSHKQLDAAIEAAEHLLAHGLSPIFDVDTIRRLWRRDRALAAVLAEIAGAA